ncbi:MAG: aspartate aminotransferase family protein [Bacteroidota bacterium]
MISQRQLFLQHLAQTSPAPMMLEIVSAEGCYLTDVNGKKYLDFISGISVSNIGHRHPDVVAAVKEQVDLYMHLMVYGEYIQSPQVKLAQLLASLTPGIDSYYFVNSGSEAIDGVIKLARRFTGRKKILACTNAYHGSTLGAISLMSNEYFRSAYHPLLPEVDFIEFNNTSSLTKIDATVACVITEVIQAEAGVITPEPDFLNALQKKCKTAGALFAIDEIQTGFGRTGTLFAFMKHSLQPDIIAIAKGMGGGMPIGAFGASKNMMQCLSDNPVLGHITTFGGHPVSCAAAYATLNFLITSKIIETVAAKEKLIRTRLNHPAIKNISGDGLLLAVQFESAEQNHRIINECIANGLITDWFLYDETKMRLAPPLTISTEEIKSACNILTKSINSVA